NIDSTAKAGDNFYRFATGHWIDYNPQPESYPRWGTFDQLGKLNSDRLRDLIEELGQNTYASGSSEQKVADLYRLMMDSLRLNKEGFSPIRPELERIQALPDREAFLQYILKDHHTLFVSIGIGADDKNSTQHAVWLWQAGKSLGNRDYYLKDDSALVAVRNAFKDHIVALYRLCGVDSAVAVQKRDIVMRYETEMAQVSRSREDLRDPENNYNKMSVKELQELTHYDWDKILKQYGYEATDTVIVGQPEVIQHASRYFASAPVEELKTLYEFYTIRDAATSLSDDFIAEDFRFSQKLTGAKTQHPRYKRAVDFVNSVMSDDLGQIYVKRYFPESSKKQMLELVGNLKTALGNRIQAQEWMSDPTKTVALEKLSTFKVKIGYPDQWDDMSRLKIDPELSLYENKRQIELFGWEFDKEKHYNKPVDPEEWYMSPQTVNAYYNPGTNEICFPAGILQPPFFDPNADASVNYGAIGAVIGHEMTHGFDDQGRQYDKNGNLRQWWSDADVEAFKKPADALATYFDSLWVIPGELHSNGRLCLGENLADHGGVSVAFEAFKLATQKHPLKEENGFSPEQRFFLSYANVWAGTTTPEMLHRLTMNDVHSCQHLRVNGTLPHIDAWYEAFDVKPGDSLYVAPENRVRIW
ncbi:MAG: M13 family metallopeptidase, partial [Paludibacteraceae bacterium]|nr:M13 family metallopeptidase [Paludibacteraceae bacterium]